jgi:hypothetical protein
VVHVLDCEIELVFVPLRVTAILAAAIGQHAQELDLVAVEERDHAIVQKVWTAPDFPEAILVEDYAAILGSSRVA